MLTANDFDLAVVNAVRMLWQVACPTKMDSFHGADELILAPLNERPHAVSVLQDLHGFSSEMLELAR